MDAGALLDLLGNENRRRILQLISRKPCYVTEISDHLGVSPKAVIDHLRKLEDAGIIESQTDDHRRKYFHIAQNLRLEVTLAPYGFGMKSAYPASPSLDLSSCQYLSLEATRTRVTHRNQQDATTTPPRGPEITSLAEDLDELEVIARELSLAQRWVQGQITDILDDLTDVIDDADYLDAEILAIIATGPTTPDAISQQIDIPTPVAIDCLHRLADAGIVREDGEEWRLLQ